MEDRRVTIVQYDLTSSEDEKDSDQTYVYSSSKLSPLSASEFLFEPPAEQHQGDHGEQNSVLVVESDSASDEAGPCTSASKRPRLSGHASSDLEIIANTAAAAPIYLESPSQSEEQDDEFSERPLLPDGASSDLEVIPSPAAAAAPICVSSSSESEDSEALVPGRKPYSMRLQELPASLREFLAEASAFFTSSHRLERAGQRVSLTTYGKAQERILCFLGYVTRCNSKEPLTPDVFTRAPLLEGYLDHLKDHRSLSSATIANHASSLGYPLKYIYRREAPNFANVPIIAQLRRMATILQRKGDVERPKTREDLRALNRWIDWDEVLEATSLQRARFEVARTKRNRAREAADFLLLSLYVHIPPSRGLEVRTLEVVKEEGLGEPFAAARFANRNVALLQEDGGITIYVQNYKTCKFAGSDTVPIEADSELCRFFRKYVEEFRPELSSAQEKNDFLFVNTNGQPYSGSSFSKHMKNLMIRLTGREASINTLRSSFLTWAYSQSECNDSMKDSLAAALRHSREQAQNTYDRRTAAEKKAAALRLARQKAEGGADAEEALQATEQSSKPEITVGQFVGLVTEDSTLQRPSILLGRVQAFLPEEQVSLLWYRNMGGGLYHLEVDGTQWTESVEALVPVKVVMAKARSHAYRLATSVRTIHKAVHGVSRDS